MKEFILGKTSESSLEIQNECVSRLHARVTLDNGTWILEDLGSTNGTFIKDDNGDFQRIKKVEITEFTRIALGATNATGFHFYAHHLLEENGRYLSEMQYVISLNEIISEEIAAAEKDTHKKGWIFKVIPVIVCLILGGSYFLLTNDFNALRIMTVATPLSAVGGFFINKQSKRVKDLQKKRRKLVRCPKCDRPLSEQDIENGQCPVCRIHS